jgi:hypothetical protein
LPKEREKTKAIAFEPPLGKDLLVFPLVALALARAPYPPEKPGGFLFSFSAIKIEFQKT